MCAKKPFPSFPPLVQLPQYQRWRLQPVPSTIKSDLVQIGLADTTYNTGSSPQPLSTGPPSIRKMTTLQITPINPGKYGWEGYCGKGRKVRSEGIVAVLFGTYYLDQVSASSGWSASKCNKKSVPRPKMLMVLVQAVLVLVVCSKASAWIGLEEWLLHPHCLVKLLGHNLLFWWKQQHCLEAIKAWRN